MLGYARRVVSTAAKLFFERFLSMLFLFAG